MKAMQFFGVMTGASHQLSLLQIILIYSITLIYSIILVEQSNHYFVSTNAAVLNYPVCLYLFTP